MQKKIISQATDDDFGAMVAVKNYQVVGGEFYPNNPLNPINRDNPNIPFQPLEHWLDRRRLKVLLWTARRPAWRAGVFRFFLRRRLARGIVTGRMYTSRLPERR